MSPKRQVDVKRCRSVFGRCGDFVACYFWGKLGREGKSSRIAVAGVLVSMCGIEKVACFGVNVITSADGCRDARRICERGR